MILTNTAKKLSYGDIASRVVTHTIMKNILINMGRGFFRISSCMCNPWLLVFATVNTCIQCVQLNGKTLWYQCITRQVLNCKKYHKTTNIFLHFLSTTFLLKNRLWLLSRCFLHQHLKLPLRESLSLPWCYKTQPCICWV